MTEDKLEQEMLSWLSELGYKHLYGPDIACDGPSPERSNYQEVVLLERLRRAIDRLNPAIPRPMPGYVPRIAPLFQMRSQINFSVSFGV